MVYQDFAARHRAETDVAQLAFKQEGLSFQKAGDLLYQRHLDISNPLNLLEQALNEYFKALERMPDDPVLAARIARIFLKQGKTSQAEKYAIQALEYDANISEAHFVMGKLGFKKRSYRQAMTHLKQSAHSDLFSSSHAHFAMFHTRWKQVYEENNPIKAFLKSGAAASHLIMAFTLLLLDPTRPRLRSAVGVLLGLSKAYFKEFRHHRDGALAELLLLHEKYPGLPVLMNIIGQMYHQKGLMEEAKYWYRRSLARDPANEESYLNMARLYEELGEFEESLKLYTDLEKLNPANASVYCSMANTYYLCQEYETAVSYYKCAFQISTDPHWRAMISQSIANIYHENFQNLDAAQMAVQMSITLNPHEVEHYTHLGVIQFEQGDFRNAMMTYEQALRIDPYNARIHTNLGYLKWMMSEIDTSMGLYEQAISLDPKYEVPYNNLGVIYLDSIGNVAKAMYLLTRAVELNEHYALAYYNLGRAYSFLDQKLEAASCFQKAQQLNEYTRELDNEELVARINHLFSSFDD
ncbi:MAG: tetratricopeptide repeat protein [Vampirovibrio sp.]|nr:tetratricopeptide repeat protein [Vampirovibrio sp.]